MDSHLILILLLTVVIEAMRLEFEKQATMSAFNTKLPWSEMEFEQ